MLNRVRELRKQIRKKVQEEISSEYNEAKKQSRYPWEGMWLTSQDIGEVQAGLQKRDRIVFIELIILFLALTIFLFIFINFTLSFLPGQNGKLTDHAVQQTPVSASMAESNPEFSTISSINERSHNIKNRMGKVNSSVLRLREGPGINYKITAKLKYGMPVTVKDKKGAWLKVLSGNSLVGWVLGEHIQL